MKNLAKTLFCFLIVIFSMCAIHGQNAKTKEQNARPKVFSPDGNLVAKNVVQNRKITEYFDGGSFRCGIYGAQNECDYKKIREFIWQCLTEKTRGYLTINFSSVDADSTEHIFIEPNKQDKWQIVRRAEQSHAVLKINKIVNLPVPFSVEKADDKRQSGEWILVLKDKFGKVLDEY